MEFPVRFCSISSEDFLNGKVSGLRHFFIISNSKNILIVCGLRNRTGISLDRFFLNRILALYFFCILFKSIPLIFRKILKNESPIIFITEYLFVNFLPVLIKIDRDVFGMVHVILCPFLHNRHIYGRIFYRILIKNYGSISANTASAWGGIP